MTGEGENMARVADREKERERRVEEGEKLHQGVPTEREWGEDNRNSSTNKESSGGNTKVQE